MSDPREFFVYRVFDSTDQLLYVGCTKRLDKRWSEHKSNRPGMVAATTRCRVQGPYTYEVARALEHTAIRTEEPLLGWTPARHREKCGRSRWIDQRMNHLCNSGMDWPAALTQAVADADEWFPDPYEHERDYSRAVA
ncbi:GIY-YIG nuclease family protein [Mycobacterium asiaticum]|uniref:GIY-YIG domain-containing protein n=1 Tax=Mycobacterium asiaticum TaxID=1790 RepID=A0A1A3NL13_MYCAS|nr:GIY-YIG nuclease family protein [Mycobacterium asiaticum]OBK22516.1 hypothetical protein A5635_21605 [Mycobacterium asiaticum]